jgi:hypothetical protein
MEDLPFYSRLNPLQKSYADKIAAEARAMGISPKLAVAIAYQESRLNPNVSTGGAGEIGIMQIKPTTAQEMGFSTKDIADPEKNIKAGLAYLKKSLELSQGDERLAAAGYNAGINHPFFTPKGNKLPETTVNYLVSLKESGAFSPPPEATEPAAEQAAAEPDIDLEKAQTIGTMGGAALGTGVSARRAITDLAKAGGKKAAQGIAEAVAQRMGPMAPPEPSAPIGGTMATSMADDAAQRRILQGTIEPETGTTGRARMGGFNIETAQQAARAKQAAQNVGALQRAGVLAQSAPDVLANAPGMTASPSGVLFPRTSSVPMPTPPARGALEEVTEVFKRMIGPDSRARSIGGALMRYGAPPLALAQAGSETGALMTELDRPEADPMMATLRGIGALGAFGSMFPTTAPIAIPVAAAAPMFASAIEEGRRRPLGQVGDVVAP